MEVGESAPDSAQIVSGRHMPAVEENAALENSPAKWDGVCFSGFPLFWVLKHCLPGKQPQLGDCQGVMTDSSTILTLADAEPEMRKAP